MYVRCYSTWAPSHVQEQLWSVLRSKGWIGATAIKGINYFYIPENLETWCLLIDSSLKRVPEHDWIV
jgi:hypothetical protein